MILRRVEVGQSGEVAEPSWNGPGERVVIHLQLPESRELRDLRWDPAGEKIVGDLHVDELGQVPDRRRDFAVDVAVREEDPVELGQAQNHLRERTGIEGVIPDAEHFQIGEAGERTPRESTGDGVIREVQHLELVERRQVGDGAGEVVEGEVKAAEAGAVPEVIGDGAVEAIIAEGERGERGEAAEGIEGYLARNASAREVDLGYGSIGIAPDSIEATGGVTRVPRSEGGAVGGGLEGCFELQQDSELLGLGWSASGNEAQVEREEEEEAVLHFLGGDARGGVRVGYASVK